MRRIINETAELKRNVKTQRSVLFLLFISDIYFLDLLYFVYCNTCYFGLLTHVLTWSFRLFCFWILTYSSLLELQKRFTLSMTNERKVFFSFLTWSFLFLAFVLLAFLMLTVLLYLACPVFSYKFSRCNVQCLDWKFGKTKRLLTDGNQSIIVWPFFLSFKSKTSQSIWYIFYES